MESGAFAAMVKERTSLPQVRNSGLDFAFDIGSRSAILMRWQLVYYCAQESGMSEEASPPIDWLLSGEPWVEYRTRIDLLGETESVAAVQSTRKRMLAHPLVRGLLKELADWPGGVLANHKNAGLMLHKLTFVADLGVKKDDPGVVTVVRQILKHRSEEGPFQSLMNVATHFGGTGHDQWAWMLCDAPLVIYGLAKFGLADDPEVQKAVGYLAGLVRANGWPCAVSPELGSFRGPGRKDDPCPFANLAMLKLLAQMPAWRDDRVSRIGAETLLTVWQDSRKRHPYLFYMGTDFRKLKAPLVWFDILHVLDVLSHFPWLHQDERFREMASLLRCKADTNGRFTPESVWTAWKDWEFGQKKEPSRWVTLLAWRILNRVATGRGKRTRR
jgi:hypothetical protein